MGVPALFRWLSTKYPKIISPVIEELPREVNGEEIPIDITGKNPNGEEQDNLYLDMNGIVHPCSHPEDRPPPSTEADMMLEIFKYTERVVNMVRPRKLLMIAIDGVAPRAKMNQQRSRRFRSAQEAQEKDEDKAEFMKLLKQQNGGILPDHALEEAAKKTWDSNAITPGTPFMDILASSLRYWIAYKLNTDAGWKNLKIIISDASVPGEGEHKIMEFIRSQRTSPEHDPNTRHVIYGLDADLIMLGLATHEPHFRVLREDVFFQDSKARTCRICGQTGHLAAECRGEVKKKVGQFDEKANAPALKPFIWLHVSILREYLEVEMSVPHQGFKMDLERALDDWVFMCFFVGNDFLPHLPSLDIREQGIDTLIAIWRDNLPRMGGYVTKDGHVDFARAQHILSGLALQEDAIFKRRKEEEERRAANQKRRSGVGADNNNNNGRPAKRGKGESTMLNIANFKTSTLDSLPKNDLFRNNDKDKAEQANKSAAALLKARLAATKPEANESEPTDTPSGVNDDANDANNDTHPSGVQKRKRELVDNDEADIDAGIPGRDSPAPAAAAQKVESDEAAPDNVRMWEHGYQDRYYSQKFHKGPEDIEFRHQVARDYAMGLQWVLLYYFQGCPSWTWYYPHHYAPFAADFVKMDAFDPKFDLGQPFKPYEQLMGVMPAASNHTIPTAFHSLMTDEDSDIIDFYPEKFPIDLNGKKWAWQGVALLPFIDEKRLLTAMDTKYHLLSDEEVKRNTKGRDALLFSDEHPLYEHVVTSFYSKKAKAENLKLKQTVSDGLAGKVEKNEHHIPLSTVPFPLETEGIMPDIESDRSIAVHYEMPKSSNVHKSMILRGVKFPPPALTNEDKAITASKAQRTGRSHGGVPFRGNSNRGSRGGGGHNGGGRGGFSYSPNGGQNDRPNPFGAHINPNFFPPPPGYGPPPPLPVSGQGYGVYPPPPGYGYQQPQYGYQGGQQQQQQQVRGGYQGQNPNRSQNGNGYGYQNGHQHGGYRGSSGGGRGRY